MVFLEFFDPLGICLLVTLVSEILVAAFPFALFKTMALCVPFVASDEAGGVEGRSVLDDCAGEKLFVDRFAIPLAN